MGLIGNKSIYYKSPATFMCGGATGLGNDAGTYSPSRTRSRYIGDDYSDLAATPAGNTPGVAWVFPIKGGAIASVNDSILTITTAASGTMGLPAEGSTTYSITFADATSQLIVSGTGTAEFAITTNNPLLTASLAAIGATSISITTNTPVLGAEANLTAATTYTITGSLTPYAIGHMIGSALPYTELSPQSLAAAVWDSVIADYQTPGSTGEALFAAGGGTTPTSIWQYVVDGGYSAEELMRLMAAAMAGKVSGAEGTTTTFRDIGDSKDRITATVDASGNRTAITLDAT